MKTKLIYLAFLIILIFPTFRFFLGDKMFTFNDETQIANLHEYFKAFDLGQFPPRWAPDMHFEYGSPFLSFNYQLPYYLGYLGHLFHLPLTVTFKLLLALTVVAGALGMFFLGEEVTGSSLFALFAAVLFSYTPYQSIDHFVRGAIGEDFALALFPWIFLIGYSMIKKINPIKILLLGLTFGLLIISHQPAALFALPFFALIFGVSALLSQKIKFILAFVKALSLGLILSAYYWLPVILEKGYANLASPFLYSNQFPFLKQLIYSSWSYQGANPFSTDTFSFQIGLVNIVILLAATAAVLFTFRLKAKDKFETWIYRLVLLTTFLSIFLMNIRSEFVWRLVPLMQSIQFPWRLLMFTTLFTPILFLFLIKKLPLHLAKPITLLLLTASIAINVGYFHPGLIVARSDSYYLRLFFAREVIKPGETVSRDYLNYAEDYAPLPAGAIRPKSLPVEKITAANPDTKIVIIRVNPFNTSAKINNRLKDTLTFHTFYYPGWVAAVDGYPAQIRPDKIGAMTVDLSPGQHTISFTFKDTPIRLISNIISLVTLIFIAFYLAYYFAKSHASSRN